MSNKVKILLFLAISHAVLADADYNSQTTPRCAEFTNNEGQCVSQGQYCCFVHNSYWSYDYIGCLDVQTTDARGQESFCKNFYQLSNSDGFSVYTCTCPNYKWLGGSYMRVGILIVLLFITLII
jgi:hypothetical protein